MGVPGMLTIQMHVVILTLIDSRLMNSAVLAVVVQNLCTETLEAYNKSIHFR